MVLEIAYINFWKSKGEYETLDTLTSLLMGTGSVVSGLVFGFISYGFAIWAYQYGSGWLLLFWMISDITGTIVLPTRYDGFEPNISTTTPASITIYRLLCAKAGPGILPESLFF